MASSVLNRQVPWPELAAVLDIPVPSKVMPCLTVCPLCHKEAFRVYDEPDGNFFSCMSCRNSGDMIELASLVWNVSLSDAAERLCQPELESQIPRYVEYTAGRKRRLDAFYEKASSRQPTRSSPVLAGLIDRFCLKVGFDNERWRAGPARFLGTSTFQGVETTFCPGSVDQGGYGQPRTFANPSHTRVFRGARWSDVLVLPFHSTADHLSAMLFVGRKGDTEDRVFRPTGLTKDYEAGIYGIHTAETHRRVIGFYNPMVVLRLQLRNFGTSTLPLPMVGWFDDGKYRTDTAWRSLGKPGVIWSIEPCIKALAQALNHDLDLSTVGPQSSGPTAFGRYLYNMTPDDIARRVLKNARPWSEVANEWLADIDDGTMGVYVQQLLKRKVDVRRMAKALDAETADRIYAIIDAGHQSGFRSVSFGMSHVVERADGWYLCTKGKSHQVTDFFLNFTEVERLGPKIVYRGTVRWRNLERQCEISISASKTNAVKRDVVQALANVGVSPVYVATGWARKLLMVAMKFSNPIEI